MTLILGFYGFIASGSGDENSAKVMIIIIVLLFVAIGLIFYLDNKNKEKRLSLKREFEEQEKDFDLSDKLGDDKIGLYFDKEKEKVLLINMTSDGLKKFYIDDFRKTSEVHSFCEYCILDDERKKALFVQSYGEIPQYEVINYWEKNKNKDIDVNNSIPSKFLNPNSLASFVLVEEKYGYITVFYNCFSKSFNYVDEDRISLKKGDKSFMVIKEINSYMFLMDNFFNVLIIISGQFPKYYKIFNYSDIINVTYEEDGNTLYSKSMTRTVGGTLVGGVLMGSAGAIVGGLSGDTSQNRIIQSMNIKILVRNTTEPSVNFPINRSGETFNTKDENSKKIYQSRIKEANAIKDLFSVIIDNSNQQMIASSSQKVEVPKPTMSIADELLKLAQLKDAGVLSEEEFRVQKEKLLS